MTPQVLVIDDGSSIRSDVGRALARRGCDVTFVADGAGAAGALGARRFDAVVMDLLVPGREGIYIAREVQAVPSPPVLVLTAFGALPHDMASHAAGELLARVEALLERSLLPEPVLTFADLRLDRRTREAWRGARQLELTPKEHELLEVLLRNPRQVMTRADLFRRVWGYDPELGSNSLDVYVGYLRRKTEAGGEPRLLRTVRGVGFVLREP